MANGFTNDASDELEAYSPTNELEMYSDIDSDYMESSSVTTAPLAGSLKRMMPKKAKSITTLSSGTITSTGHQMMGVAENTTLSTTITASVEAAACSKRRCNNKKLGDYKITSTATQAKRECDVLYSSAAATNDDHSIQR